MNSSKNFAETSFHLRSSDELQQDWVLMRGLDELRSQRHLADVIIIVEGKPLPACHRFVLYNKFNILLTYF